MQLPDEELRKVWESGDIIESPFKGEKPFFSGRTFEEVVAAGWAKLVAKGFSIDGDDQAPEEQEVEAPIQEGMQYFEPTYNITDVEPYNPEYMM